MPTECEPIAIVGSACRFPGGATSPAKLWELLKEPRDVLRDFKSVELRPDLNAFHSDNGEQPGRTEVQSKAYVLEEDPNVFDASFFNITPLEAEAMDPQQRLLLETVYESLEAAGKTLDDAQGSQTAVFVGSMSGDYYDIQVRDTDTLLRYHATGTARSLLANRISYFFDLKGPSITIDTACSSSLVCLHLAVQSIRNGECSSAIAAGCNLIMDPNMFLSESSLHMLSEDSRSRMWDSSANGYARGEGVASILLKPLSQAIKDGDHIESVIRHSAVNSDGRTAGITMPSPVAQANLIRKTYAESGLDPMVDKPQFFECHGTGTAAGDPVEAEAIYDAFFAGQSGGEKKKLSYPLFVGSIKTIIGHLEGCAGLAGVLKASLSLQHQTIPPNMHFNELNKKIIPFYTHLCVPTKALPWPEVQDGPRRASINSFGFGGTNSHVILESYTSPSEVPSMEQSLNSPFVFSAQSERTLFTLVKSYLEHIKAHKDLSLSDLSWTLQCKRGVFPFRTFFSATSREDLIKSLEKYVGGVENEQKPAGISQTLVSNPPEIPGVLGIFTGQGAQWPTMGTHLIRSSRVFREAIQACEKSLSALPDGPKWSLADELMAPAETSRVPEAALSQPLCTAVQLGLVDLLRNSGVPLDTVVGHSSGEIAATYAAGIISSEDAIRIAYYRGLFAHLAQGTSGQKGLMMAVGLSLDAAREFCSQEQYAGRVSVAAGNSPASVTISGDEDAIYEAKKYFDEAKTFARLLRVDTAYHSHHMAPASEPYLEALRRCQIKVNPPRDGCNWISSVKGDILPRNQYGSLRDQYWVDNMLKPVLFSYAVEVSLWNGGPYDSVVELGCHPALKGPVNQILSSFLGKSLPYIEVMKRGENEVETFSSAIGFTWQILGPAFVDFEGYRQSIQQRQDDHKPRPLKDLPHYAWDHDRTYWRESRISRRYRLRDNRPHELLGRRMPEDSDTDMRWRNILRLKDIPWIRDHQFQGQALLPGASYVSMSLEAAQIFAAGRQIRLIELLDARISRAAAVEDDHRSVEIIFSMSKCLDEDAVNDDKTMTADVSCQLCFDEVSGDLTRSFTGRVLIHLGPASDTKLLHCDENRQKLRPVDSEVFQNYMSKLGLNYQGAFRALSKIERSLGYSRAEGSWPLSQINFGNAPHPALLDVGFQSLFVAHSSPASEQIWAPYLPIYIKRLSYNPHVSFTAKDMSDVQFETHLTQSTATILEGDIYFSSIANPALCGIQVEGLTAKSFTEPRPSNDRLLFTKTLWRPDLLSTHSPEIEGVEHPDDIAVVEAAERMTLYYFQRALAQIESNELSSMQWNHQAFYKYMQDMTDQARNGTHPTANPEWIADSEEDIEQFTKTFPDQIDILLGNAVGSRLVDVMRGKVEQLQLMIENDMLNRYYAEGAGIPHLNNLIAKAMSQITHRHPGVKVLEIGAGTGGMTRAVMDVIGRTYASWTFTDISAGFFEKAKEKFSDHYDKMIYEVLNIEKNPTDQGFEEGAYDVIIASNVLHATKFMKDTLNNTRSLLKPGGYLVLAEVTGDLLRLSLVFGGLPGWWLGIEDGRTNGPGSNLVQWDELLQSTGFSGVDLYGHDNADSQNHLCSAIISQAVSDEVQILRDPVASSELILEGAPIVIIGGKDLANAKLVNQLRKSLSVTGERVIHVDSIDKVQFDHIPVRSRVLGLAELDQPIFTNNSISTQRMTALQTVFGNAESVLWVSKGRFDGDPQANMMLGLGRALLEEHPHLALQLLDIGNNSTTADFILENFLRLVFLKSLPEENDTLWTQEPELYFDGEAMHIPRIVMNSELNHRLNSARRSVEENVDSKVSKVEIQQHGTSLKLAQNMPTMASVVELSADMVRVRVKNSLTINQELILCMGFETESQQAVLLFSDRHSSMLDVLRSNVFYLPISDDTVASPEFISHIAKHVLITSALANIPSSEKSVVVYGVDEDLSACFSRRTASESYKMTFVSDQSPTTAKKDWIYIDEVMTGSAIRRILPKIPGSFIDLTDGSGKYLRLPSTYSRRSLRFPTVDQPMYLEEAYEKVIEDKGRKGFSNAQVITMASLNQAPAAALRFPAVVNWDSSDQVSVNIAPLNPSALIRSNKTYLLVGMTSELGLSLCRHMIVSGAQHIVLSSRKPDISTDFLEEMAGYGANIRVVSMDISDMTSLRSVVDEIRQEMPPIAGVCNAGMVLHDRLFMDMTAEEMSTPFAAKIQGTKNLDALFSDKAQPLDFFILFSSLGTITGNGGQSNYHVANMFMCGLTEQRRRRGLVASVMHIAIVVDVGYVARADRKISEHLRKRGYLPLSETDVHTLFTEAILASNPQSAAAEIICGLEPVRTGTDVIKSVPWAWNPRFSHLVIHEAANEAQQGVISQSHETLKRIESSNSIDEIRDIVTEAFIVKLEALLQLQSGTARPSSSLLDLGCDSLSAVEIRAWLLKEIKVEVPVLKLLGGDSITELCNLAAMELLSYRKGADATDGKANESEPSSTQPSSSSASGTQTPLTDSPTIPTPLESKPSSPRQVLHESSQRHERVSDGQSSSPHFRQSQEANTKSSVNQLYEPLQPDHSSLERIGEMSFPQKRLWFSNGYSMDLTAFNVVTSYKVKGSISPMRLRLAFNNVMAKYESLRTRFFVEGNELEPRQAVQSEVPDVLRIIDANENDAIVSEVISNYRTKIWDLARSVAFEATLITHSKESHELIFSYHHILVDGMSMVLLLADLDRAYKMAPLDSVHMHPCDFALAEKELSRNGRLNGQIEFWQKQLLEAPQVIPLLPMARVKSRRASGDWSGNTASHTLSSEITTKIKAACRYFGVTQFHFHLAAVQVLLSKLLGVDDVCIGTTDANRSDSRFVKTVGFLLNLLPLRFRIDQTTTLTHLMKSTAANVLAANQNSEVPFELIMDAIGAVRSPVHTPLFQLVVNYRAGSMDEVPLGSCQLTSDIHFDAKVPYDLNFNMVQTGSGGCLMHLTGRDYLYSQETCETLMKMYASILESLYSNYDQAVQDVQFLDPEKNGLKPSVSHGAVFDFGWPPTLIDIFDRVKAANEHQIAVVDKSQKLTYDELAVRSGTIANALLALDLAPSSVIGVLLEPSTDTVATVLAILRIGCVFMPLDLSLSKSRHKVMLREGQASLIICDAHTESLADELKASEDGEFPVLPVHTLHEVASKVHFIENVSRPDMPVALLYSSGSTGVPKGTLLLQQGIINHVASKNMLLSLKKETILQQSSTGFDMFIGQVFGAIASEGTIVMVPQSSRGDPVKITKLMRDESVTLTFATPSEYLLLLRYGNEYLQECVPWKHACLGGEVVSEQIKEEFRWLGHDGPRLTDFYGPTEVSIATTLNPIDLSPNGGKSDDYLPVGKPIPNTSIYVVDESGNPTTVGLPGEIVVAGAGVSLGYVNKAMNTNKFTDIHFPGTPHATRVYRTGDRGRLLKDGTLVFLGRLDGDSTIKLRGLRIDLDDIGANIVRASNNDIVEACIVVKGKPEFLVAYVVLAQDSTAGQADLREVLRRLDLPRYMVPARAIILDRLPRNSNGKIDRRGLMGMQLPDAEEEQGPGADSENNLSLIGIQLKIVWKEVLGNKTAPTRLTRNSDFFMSGGNSHLLVKLRAVIQETFGISLALGQLYRASNLAEMTSLISLSEPDTSSVPETIDWGSELSKVLASIDVSSSIPRGNVRVYDRHVILTGATGFLGSSILQQLLKEPSVGQIHCVAISEDERDLLPETPKVVIYMGSLTRPRMGLSKTEQIRLQGLVDLVIHAGSNGHCLNNYQSLVVPNTHSTARLAILAAPRRAPIHFVSSSRVTLLSGQNAYPAKSIAEYPPRVDGAEGFVSTKWLSERILESVAETMGINVCVHRPCASVGDKAPSYDGLNALIRYSVLMKAVPDIPNVSGFFDFKHVDEIAAGIVEEAMVVGAEAVGQARFRHHSSRRKVPVENLRQYLEELHSENFVEMEMGEWLKNALELGVEPIVVSFFETVIARGETVRFPFLGV